MAKNGRYFGGGGADGVKEGVVFGIGLVEEGAEGGVFGAVWGVEEGADRGLGDGALVVRENGW